jgi:hypothetical protein
VTLQEYFSYQVQLFTYFPTPLVKLKMELQIGGRLLIANHLDKLLRLDKTGREQQSDHICYTLLWQVLGFNHVLLSASAKSAKMLSQNHFAEPNRHVLTFLHPALIFRVTYSSPVELPSQMFNAANGLSN